MRGAAGIDAGREGFAASGQLTIATSADNSWFAYPGEEIVLVHAGVLEVRFEGREAVTIAAGDSLYYPGEVPHMWRNPSDEPTTVTHIVSSGAHHPPD